MNNLTKEFVSEDNKQYRFKIGHLMASSLSGFVAGAVFATIVWVAMEMLLR